MRSSYRASPTIKLSPAIFGGEILSKIEVNEVNKVLLIQSLSRILDFLNYDSVGIQLKYLRL